MTSIAILPAARGMSVDRAGWHACPSWCVDCWGEVDPGTAFHHGRVYAVGPAQVSVERFDAETEAAGEVRVYLTSGRDGTLTPDQCRALAVLLLRVAAEGEQS